jgi:hypothetical protein
VQDPTLTRQVRWLFGRARRVKFAMRVKQGILVHFDDGEKRYLSKAEVRELESWFPDSS